MVIEIAPSRRFRLEEANDLRLNQSCSSDHVGWQFYGFGATSSLSSTQNLRLDIRNRTILLLGALSWLCFPSQMFEFEIHPSFIKCNRAPDVLPAKVKAKMPVEKFLLFPGKWEKVGIREEIEKLEDVNWILPDQFCLAGTPLDFRSLQSLSRKKLDSGTNF